jgi:hypothetical protein
MTSLDRSAATAYLHIQHRYAMIVPSASLDPAGRPPSSPATRAPCRSRIAELSVRFVGLKERNTCPKTMTWTSRTLTRLVSVI